MLYILFVLVDFQTKNSKNSFKHPDDKRAQGWFSRFHFMIFVLEEPPSKTHRLVVCKTENSHRKCCLKQDLTMIMSVKTAQQLRVALQASLLLRIYWLLPTKEWRLIFEAITIVRSLMLQWMAPLWVYTSYEYMGATKWIIGYYRHNRDATLMKSQQYDCVNRICTMITLVDVPNMDGTTFHKAPPAHVEL